VRTIKMSDNMRSKPNFQQSGVSQEKQSNCREKADMFEAKANARGKKKKRNL